MGRILGSVADMRRLPVSVPDGGFSLRNVGNLKLWLRGDLPSSLGITSSPKVDSWTDQSSSALVFEQSTANLKPETGNTINGRNAISSDGVDDVLQEGATPFTGTKGYAFAALRIPGSVPAANGNILACGNGGVGTAYFSPIRYDYDSGSGKLYFGVTARTGATVHGCRGSTEIAADTTYIVETYSDDDDWFIRVNGVLNTLTVISGANSGFWAGDVASLTNVTLFDLNISGGAANSKVWLGEAGLIDGRLPSEGEMGKIRRYLANKWGATLS